ncbi:unnamed protein product [Didymodactylos carnosus]|uniref:Integrase catalytic domain-containing protein n=1 Tax=Didymodactylos carnosus TaxID=1234261 RepID=A0A814NUX7_9BILA|nr:unnamed protein product [Didymodactylos carnosus]CAF3862206.1 unnamed protein product [Didymodactylos carnosus]
MMTSPISSPSIMRKCKPVKKKTEISSSITTTTPASVTCSSTATTTAIDIAKWKNDFNDEILTSKNDSTNNPLFTSERYDETIELINGAKLKRYSDRNEQEIALLKTYDVINVGGQQKLVKKINSSEDGIIKYYVSLDELFDVVQTAHVTIGHRGINNTLKEIKKKYANVTERQVKLFISGCHECKIKCSKPKNSSKLVVQPVISHDFNARGQVDLIDMQSCPDGPFKFILNYQDHFTKFCVSRPMKTKTAAEVAYHLLDIFTMFGAPVILQSHNGREFVAKVIEELTGMWQGLKIVHGRARHPQSQGSVERCNQDTKQLIGTWIRENSCKKWSQGLRFVQFQKNSCHHRVLKHSPYSVLFGHEPKIGLTSTSLHPSIFDSITTEEELEKELGIPAVADQDTIDEGESSHETEGKGSKNDDEESSGEQDGQDLDMSPLNDRIQRTNEIRQDAREGQKRQADQFLQNTFKKQKLANLNVGDNVLVSVPDVDRAPTDARNILAVIMEIKHDKYKLGTELTTFSSSLANFSKQILKRNLIGF